MNDSYGKCRRIYQSHGWSGNRSSTFVSESGVDTSVSEKERMSPEKRPLYTEFSSEPSINFQGMFLGFYSKYLPWNSQKDGTQIQGCLKLKDYSPQKLSASLLLKIDADPRWIFSCWLQFSFREGKIWPNENDPKKSSTISSIKIDLRPLLFKSLRRWKLSEWMCWKSWVLV